MTIRTRRTPRRPPAASMSWLVQTGATATEMTPTAALRPATTSLHVAVVVDVLCAASHLCLAVVLSGRDLSVAYAARSAVGIAEVAAIGAVVYHERLTALRLLALALIAAAVALLCRRLRNGPPGIATAPALPAPSGVLVALPETRLPWLRTARRPSRPAIPRFASPRGRLVAAPRHDWSADRR